MKKIVIIAVIIIAVLISGSIMVKKEKHQEAAGAGCEASYAVQSEGRSLSGKMFTARTKEGAYRYIFTDGKSCMLIASGAQVQLSYSLSGRWLTIGGEKRKVVFDEKGFIMEGLQWNEKDIGE